MNRKLDRSHLRRKLHLVDQDGADASRSNARPGSTKSSRGFRRYKVSSVGQLSFPAAARQRWSADGRSVDVVDFDELLVVLPRFERRLGLARIRKRATQAPSQARRLRAVDDPQGEDVHRYKISGSGQITIPAAVRRRWAVEIGGHVEVADLGAAVVIVPVGMSTRLLTTWLNRGLLAHALEASVDEAEPLQSSG